jgi:biopolymer transport protein ExbB/TolQ
VFPGVVVVLDVLTSAKALLAADGQAASVHQVAEKLPACQQHTQTCKDIVRKVIMRTRERERERERKRERKREEERERERERKRERQRDKQPVGTSKNSTLRALATWSIAPAVGMLLQENSEQSMGEEVD